MPTPLSRSRVVLLSLFGLLVVTFIAFSVVDYNDYLANRRAAHDDLSFFIPWDSLPPVAMHIQTSVHYALDTPLGIAEWKALIPPTGHLIHLPSPDPPASHRVFVDGADSTAVGAGFAGGREGEKEVEVEYEVCTPTLLHQLKCLDILRESYVLSRSMRNSSPYTTSSHLNLTSPPHTPIDWSSPPSSSSRPTSTNSNSTSHSSPNPNDARYPTAYSGLTRHCLNYLRQSILCSMNVGLESSAADDGAPRERFEVGCRDWGRVYEEVGRNWEVWRGIGGGGEEEVE